MSHSTSLTTVVSTESLAGHLDDPDWVIVDCRFDLADPERGRAAWLQAHIPGAVYAHLNEDLSAPVVRGVTGRHPLPDAETLAATLGRLGIGNHSQVVAYDDASGAYAARLWWSLRWLGHDAVALLDGDWRAWIREGRATESGPRERAGVHFVASVRPHMAVVASEIAGGGGYRLLDARSAERYRGQNETIDPVAGHIPGALSAPWSGNVDPSGYFLPAEALRLRYAELLQDAEPSECAVYCGSGVTAAHNLVAMEIAGLSGARLFPGSWSEWITDPGRPIATGEVA
jgi:thiosulfate/3-mercaptopyruvate sulfurtransferase